MASSLRWDLKKKEACRSSLNGKIWEGVNGFSISPSLKPASDELEMALRNYRMAGKYMEFGAKNADPETINRATNYILEGNAHLTLADLRLPE